MPPAPAKYRGKVCSVLADMLTPRNIPFIAWTLLAQGCVIGKLTKFRIKLLAGDKVLVAISPYDLTRGRITYRERNAGAPGGRPGGNRPGGPRRR